MPDILLEKIVEECAINRPREIHLHNFGEPLLDADLEDRIRFIKKKCRVYVKIFTNGSLLTTDRIEKLLASGINEIKISVDGSTPKEYERIRPPLKWDEILNNIKNLIKARDTLKSRTKIYVTCCTDKSASLLLSDLPIQSIQYAMGPKHNWGGQHGNKVKGKFIKCNRLWRTFTILVDGMVVQCHADVHGKYNLGNIYTQTIKEIWNSPEYNTIRAMHEQSKQADLNLCRDCSQCRRL
jgi:MoaA/NifB/PqqE/SkfB family radical SAM enzyme